jgi:hypothetical protein
VRLGVPGLLPRKGEPVLEGGAVVAGLWVCLRASRLISCPSGFLNTILLVGRGTNAEELALRRADGVWGGDETLLILLVVWEIGGGGWGG